MGSTYLDQWFRDQEEAEARAKAEAKKRLGLDKPKEDKEDDAQDPPVRLPKSSGK